jgi:hypothetical protein
MAFSSLRDGICHAGCIGSRKKPIPNRVTLLDSCAVTGSGMMRKSGLTRMNLNVPIELHNTFKSVTAAQGQNMTDVLLDFIQTYIAKHSPKPKGRR